MIKLKGKNFLVFFMVLALVMTLGTALLPARTVEANGDSVVVLSVEPRTGTSVLTGQSFDLEVWARFSVEGRSWNAADVVLEWDPIYLRLDGGTFNPIFSSAFWPAGGVNDTWDDGNAGFTVQIYGEGNEIKEDKLLVTLHVTALAPVASTIFSVVKNASGFSNPTTMVIEPSTWEDLSGTYYGAEVCISSPDEVWVDDDFTSATPGWGTDHFAKIQDGINAIAETGTVNVAAGTYTEVITINKALTLLGAQAGVDARTRLGIGESIIDPTDSEGGATKSWVVRVQSSDVIVDGFTVQNPTLKYGSAGLFCVEPPGIEIYENLTFRNNILQNPGVKTSMSTNWGKFGYDIGYCDNVLIEYNYIRDILCDVATPWNGTAGIWPWGTRGMVIRYNKIENVTTFGIGLSDGNEDMLVYGNEVSMGDPGASAVPSGATAGIRVGLANENVRIEKNIIYNCPGTVNQPGTGIRIQSGDSIIDVIDNEVTNCPIGIRTTADAAGSKISIEGNTFADNGVQVSDGGEALVIENVLANNTFDRAVVVRDSGTNEIKVPVIYSGIQSAINDASPGDTINVYPGTYAEQVVINKSLTLQGAGDTTIIKPSQTTANIFQLFSRKADGTNNTAPVIVATDTSSVTIRNLKVDGSSVSSVPSGADNFVGILYRGVGGVIDSATVTGIGVTQKGSSILLSSMGNTVNVEVKGCTISNFLKGGITADYEGLTANIHDNIVTGSGPSSASCPNAIEVAYGATGNVTNNQVSNVAYNGTGYWWAYGIIFGDASGIATGNTLTNCQAGVGAEAPLTNSHTVTISNNTISAAGLTSVSNVFGIYACTWNDEASINATIKNNHLSVGGPGKGIQIGDTAGNGAAGTVNATIEGNEVSNWGHGIWLDLTSNEVIITGNTIANNIYADSGVHIASGVNAANVTVSSNNIEGNQTYGVYNGGTGILTATLNWWGDVSGPSGVGYGTGDAVSANVAFSPWLDAPAPGGQPVSFEEGSIVQETTETGTYTVDATAEADTEVIKSGSGTPTVTVAMYSDNPGTELTGGIGKFVDVHISDAANVDELEIRLYYTDDEITALGLDESTLKMYWWDSTKTPPSWEPCSDTGVDTASNFIWAKIRSDTTPSLNQLSGQLAGTPFTGQGEQPAPPIGGEAFPPNKLLLLAPWLALLAAIIAGAVIFVRRRQAKS